MTSPRRALRDYERSLTGRQEVSSSSSASSSAGIGIFGLLTAILLVFKLAGMAGVSWGLPNLSWFWVFAPLGVGIALSLFFILLFLVIAFFASK